MAQLEIITLLPDTVTLVKYLMPRLSKNSWTSREPFLSAIRANIARYIGRMRTGRESSVCCKVMCVFIMIFDRSTDLIAFDFCEVPLPVLQNDYF